MPPLAEAVGPLELTQPGGKPPVRTGIVDRRAKGVETEAESGTCGNHLVTLAVREILHQSQDRHDALAVLHAG